MIETTVTQSRKGQSLNAGASIAVQIDVMKPDEANFFHGAEPYFSFWMRTRGPIPSTWVIRQSDLMTDTRNIDPLTNANTVYRVAGDPSPYWKSYWRIPVELFRGKPK